MNEKTPQLNPSELYDKRKSKDVARLRAYNKILEQIYNRIRVMSKLPNSAAYLMYTVPQFILGLPKIDLEDCVVYLIYQLRHGGYEVRYSPPNMLYISWAHHERSYLIDQSPIMQSMMESSDKANAEMERKEKEASRLLIGKKSQQKVRMNTPGQLQQPYQPPSQSLRSSMTPSKAAINTVINRPNSISAGPDPPSTANYTPSSDFLRAISNPPNKITAPKDTASYFNR